MESISRDVVVVIVDDAGAASGLWGGRTHLIAGKQARKVLPLFEGFSIVEIIPTYL